jgi:hypothetical protein
MRHHLAGLFFLAAMGAAATAIAQEAAVTSETSHESLARQYVQIGGAEDLFLVGAEYAFRQGLRAEGIEVTPEQWSRIRVLLQEHYTPAATAFIAELTSFYSAHNTSEDLRAAIAYYSTPEGGHYMGAAINASFPLATHFATQGRVPLIEPPAASALDAARLESGRELAAVLATRFHPSERAAIEMTTLGVDGVLDYWARSFASTLEIADMEAAVAWAQTPESQRLEGPSAERTLAIQTATMQAVASVDIQSLAADVVTIIVEDRGSPT